MNDDARDIPPRIGIGNGWIENNERNIRVPKIIGPLSRSCCDESSGFQGHCRVSNGLVETSKVGKTFGISVAPISFNNSHSRTKVGHYGIKEFTAGY